MHKAVALAPLILVASPMAQAAPLVHGITPGHKCRTQGTDRFIGHFAGKRTGALIKRASHAEVLRWAPPGVMLTMDYREDRVTVHLGPDRKITTIRCG